MNRSPRLQLALLGGAFVALAAVVFVWRSGPAAPAEAPRLTADTTAAVPSADNVDPSFHTRLMTLRQQVDAAPRDTTLLLQFAHLQQDAHQYEGAAATYERLLALAPEQRQARLDLALCYAEAGRLDDARRATEALLARDPEDPAALYNLAALHANAGAYDEARRLWTRVGAQTRDAALAAQARASLAQLDAVASGAAPTAPAMPATPAPVMTSPAGAAPTGAAPAALPPGHPTLPALQPVMVEK